MGTNKQKRVGLFGGTFDPIHFGHLRAAEEIKEILCLDKVYFIPSAIPPHKSDSKITNSSKRLEMLKLAIEGIKYFDVSEFELQSETPSYTIKTLEYFNHTEPNTEYYFILGNEQFNHIESWKDYKGLFELSNFAVITRPGFSEPSLNKVPLALKDDFLYYKKVENVVSYTKSASKDIAFTEIVFTEIKGIEISSTDIRNFVRAKKSIKYLVPDKIEKYILTQKLYA